MNKFTDAMRQTVSGVSVITTDGDHGRFGMTVSSVTPVSAEPPLLLVCVNRSSVELLHKDHGWIGFNSFVAGVLAGDPVHSKQWLCD